MRQRVMIAIALACDPKVLIADEPTTALDVTIQAQIIELVKDLRQKLGMAIIWITHDLGVIAGIADRVMVMYAGQVVEEGPVGEIFSDPQHPYTQALLKTVPAVRGPRAEKLQVIEGQPPIMHEAPDALLLPQPLPVRIRTAAAKPIRRWLRYMQPGPPRRLLPARQGLNKRAGGCRWLTFNPEPKPWPPLVKVRDLKMYFPIHSGLFRSHTGDIKAVDGISFDIMPGETLGLVGESGCGKSTVGRSILRLYDVTGGTVEINGFEIAHVDRDSLRSKRPMMQMIFQDPQASLNPRMTVASIIGEPLDEHMKLTADERLARIYELMDWVGLNREFAKRYPHEFSGGQRATHRHRPGAGAQSEIHCLRRADRSRSTCRSRRRWSIFLEELQNRLNLTYLFISHDLSMVRHIADRVAVMYLGRIVEIASREKTVCRAAASLHPGAALGCSGAGSRFRAQPQADRAAGRRALAGKSSHGLQFFRPDAPRSWTSAVSRSPGSLISEKEDRWPAICIRPT